MSALQMVGRCGAEDLPGGAVLLLKAARNAGGWFVWTTKGDVLKPVKIVAAKDSGDGKAVYEDRLFPRVHVKGRHRDGRTFAVRYIFASGKWTADASYVSTRVHRCTLENGLTHLWMTEQPSLDAASIAHVKAYVADAVPSELTETQEVRRR